MKPGDKPSYLFALGISYRDIQGYIADMYGLEASDGAITNITNRLLPELWERQPPLFCVM